MDATAGYDPRDPDSGIHLGATLAYEASVMAALAYPGPSLRVAFVEDLVQGLGVQPDVRAKQRECMGRVRTLLQELYGPDCSVLDLSANDLDLPRFGNEWTLAVGAQGLAGYERAGLTVQEKAAHMDRSITMNWPVIREHFSLQTLGEVFAKIAENNARLADIFERCDVLVTTSLSLEAYKASGPAAFVALGESRFRTDGTDPFPQMMPLNYSGHPAAVLRAGLSETGLPCGIQLIAERGRDALLLAIASLYERRFGCFEEWPAWPFRAVATTAPSRL